MRLEHFLTPFIKINSQWVKDLNVRPETIKLLKENTGKTIFDIISRNIFELSCKAKETIDKMKRKLTEWEKIFAIHITNKGLIYKMYKQLKQLNMKKP